MDRGAQQATVHGVAESDTTEQLTLSLSFFLIKKKWSVTITEKTYWRTKLIIHGNDGISFHREPQKLSGQHSMLAT